MLKPKNSILLAVLTLAALLLGACASATPATPTLSVDAIYTAAAQTIEAKQALNTATPAPSETPAPSNTPAATITLVPSATPQPTSLTNNYCDNSLFLSDVTIPDNTVIAPGQAFVKTWAFKNTGTCTWTADGYTIIFSNGDLMSGVTRPVGSVVAPQGQANISVNLVAPNASGTYMGYWRLANGKGQPFGQTVSVVIVVGAASGTTTATVTATPGDATQAATVSPTALATDTLEPSATVTLTPKP